MTTFRRFCCNDLLRLGELDLDSENKLHPSLSYLSHMAMWPANCHVAYLPGGQVTAYIFGRVEGTGLDCCGQVTMISTSDAIAELPLSKLEDSCDKIYNAYTVRFIVLDSNPDAVIAGENFGYYIYKYLEGGVELRKPLPRLLAIAKEEMEKIDE